MSSAAPGCVIGVDGGGTGCRIGLIVDGRRHESRLGPANVSTDPEGAIARIAAGIARLASEAGLAPERLAGARLYLGLAGVTDRAMAAALEARFGQAAVRVEDDRAAAVVGALADRDGTVASIGTGSFVARMSGGRLSGVGGWGWLLGDEASGSWLGRGMLARTLLMVDGLAEPSALGRALLEEMGGPAGIVAFGFEAGPAEFAALAPRVLEAAMEEDALAAEVMDRGADYVVRAVRQLGWVPGEALCLMGGVGPAYAGRMPAEMADALVAPQGSALDGALALAARGFGADGH